MALHAMGGRNRVRSTNRDKAFESKAHKGKVH